MNAMTYPTALCAVTPISRAPTSTIPWIALVADISGVCSVAGTLPMPSMPTSSARMKMVRSVSSAVDTGVSLNWLQQAGHALVDDCAVVCDHHARLDLVAGVDGQRTVPGQVQQYPGDVPRVGLRGGGRHGGGQIFRADDRDPVAGDRRPAGDRAG